MPTAYPQMDRTEWLKVRLSTAELEKLRQHATGKGWNLSQAVREWIRCLPQKPS